MEYVNFTKGVTVPLKCYTEEEIPIMDKVIEVLLINMYGEATRNNGVYIGEFDYDEYESKICYMMATIIRNLYSQPIYVECARCKFLKFLYETKQLFKKGRVRRISKKSKQIRTANRWVRDILEANNLPYEYVCKIWEYMNEK